MPWSGKLKNLTHSAEPPSVAIAARASCCLRLPHRTRSFKPILHRRSQKRCAHGLLSPFVAKRIRIGLRAANARCSSPPPPNDSSSGWGATNKILSESEKDSIKSSFLPGRHKRGKSLFQSPRPDYINRCVWHSQNQIVRTGRQI